MPLPLGWRPGDEGRAYAEQRGLTGDNYDRELTAFRNHCADKGRRSCDWHAAWCGWVDKTRLSNGGHRPSRGDRARQLARQVEAMERAEAEAKARGPP